MRGRAPDPSATFMAERTHPVVDTATAVAYKDRPCADVAQLVEQLTRNEQVTGSSPVVGSLIPSEGPCLAVVASDTAAGKTFLAAHLIAALVARGMRVAPSKPIESGCLPGRHPEDALALTRAADLPDLAVTITCPWPLPDPVTPALALRTQGLSLTCEDLVGAVRRAASRDGQRPDLTVVEAAGGVRSPLLDDLTSIDLAARLSAITLLVVPNRLGCISAAVCAANEATRAGADLAAVVLNADLRGTPDFGHEHNADFIRRQLPHLAVIEVTTHDPVPDALIARITEAVARRATRTGGP